MTRHERPERPGPIGQLLETLQSKGIDTNELWDNNAPIKENVQALIRKLEEVEKGDKDQRNFLPNQQEQRQKTSSPQVRDTLKPEVTGITIKGYLGGEMKCKN